MVAGADAETWKLFQNTDGCKWKVNTVLEKKMLKRVKKTSFLDYNFIKTAAVFVRGDKTGQL